MTEPIEYGLQTISEKKDDIRFISELYNSAFMTISFKKLTLKTAASLDVSVLSKDAPERDKVAFMGDRLGTGFGQYDIRDIDDKDMYKYRLTWSATQEDA